jgi:hypothetical protein
MYSVNRDGEYVTITMADPEFQGSATSEVEQSDGRVVYRAKKKDLIVLPEAGAKEVGEVNDRLLVQTLHQKGILR